MKVIVDQDPDYEGFYSVFTDMDAINVELAGKIGERKIADYLAKALENFPSFRNNDRVRTGCRPSALR